MMHDFSLTDKYVVIYDLPVTFDMDKLGEGFATLPYSWDPEYPARVGVMSRDGDGRDVRIAADPQRIVSLDPGLTESAFALGASSAVVAVSGHESYPPSARKRPHALTAAGALRLRFLRSLHPDLVLASAFTSATQAQSLSRRLSAPVYVAASSTLDGLLHDVLELGIMTGRSSRGRRLAAQLRSRVGDVRAAVASFPRRRVFVDRGFFYTIPPQSLAADLINVAGGVDVAADAEPGQPYPPRKLRRARPQVYLALIDSGTTLAGLARSPALRNLPAVRHHRFAVIPARTIEDSGPRAVDSLETLARAIHPDLSLGQ
jgi:iron complex transport system substrate-binding protein